MRVTLAVIHYIGDMEPEEAISYIQAGTSVER
jgi:molybdopterin synthase catalytic subunit